MWEFDDAVIGGISPTQQLNRTASGNIWTVVKTCSSLGMAMKTVGNTITPSFPKDFSGLSLADAAFAVKSWNLPEASFGMAAINAFYNAKENLDRLNCFEPFENYCTRGLDFNGKIIGMIGHLRMPENTFCNAKALHIIERNPQLGDYPDTACEYILPQCDIVLITGSTLVNKTLPRLLELCKNAYTILTGPTVPLCPELLSFGIDRLAGLVVTDIDGAYRYAVGTHDKPPYEFGQTFILERSRAFG